MGVVVEFPRCVSCAGKPLRRHVGGRQLSGRRAVNRPASASRIAIRTPRAPSRAIAASAVTVRKGSFAVEISASAETDAVRKHGFELRLGTGDALCDAVRVCAVM
jgi:hypothetical protein